jgi:hypothetical protein
MRQLVVATLALAFAAPLVDSAEAPADLVLQGGRVWTADSAQPWAEAVAVRAGRIVYVAGPRRR